MSDELAKKAAAHSAAMPRGDGRHPHESALIEVCKATTASSYTVEMVAWLEVHYPESAARLKPVLRDIYKAKRATERADKART